MSAQVTLEPLEVARFAEEVAFADGQPIEQFCPHADLAAEDAVEELARRGRTRLCGTQHARNQGPIADTRKSQAEFTSHELSELGAEFGGKLGAQALVLWVLGALGELSQGLVDAAPLLEVEQCLEIDNHRATIASWYDPGERPRAVFEWLGRDLVLDQLRHPIDAQRNGAVAEHYDDQVIVESFVSGSLHPEARARSTTAIGSPRNWM